MCVGIPGKIIKIDRTMGTADIGGVQVYVALDLVPGAAPGDYVLIHAGYAVQVINEKEALNIWQLIKELAESD